VGVQGHIAEREATAGAEADDVGLSPGHDRVSYLLLDGERYLWVVVELNHGRHEVGLGDDLLFLGCGDVEQIGVTIRSPKGLPAEDVPRLHQSVGIDLKGGGLR